MKNLKKIGLILLCLVLGVATLSSCSLLGGDPTGEWYLTDVKNDDTGDMEEALAMCESMGMSIVCDITDSRVTIGIQGFGMTENVYDFNYRQSGNRIIDKSDNTEITFRVSGDTLTLIFSDCDMIFTRAK